MTDARSVSATEPGAGADAHDPALARVRESFASIVGDGRLTLDRLRENLDAMMLETEPASDVDVQRTAPGGVDALVVRAGDVSKAGVLVWFHGGGYLMGSPRGYRPAAAALSRALGRAVILPDYRLAPENPFPAAVEDAAAVLDAVVADYGREHVVVGGDSAGGGLAIAALVDARDRGVPLPAVAVAVSPLADFTASGASMAANAASDPVISGRSIAAFAAGYLGTRDRATPLASPVFADLTGLPPVLLMASHDEVLLDDAVRLHEGIRDVGGVSTLSVYTDALHAWTLFADVLPRGADGVDEIARFVGEALP